MATYNRAYLLPRAIDSVLAQTFEDWELIIVDDGSRDDTVGLVSRYARREKRIQYRYQDNAGLCAARNRGIESCSGSYVTFLDSDDEYCPEHLALRCDHMKVHPSIDMIEGGVKIVGGSAEVPDMYDPSKMIALADCNIGGTFFMKMEMARELRGFQKPDYGCDHDLVTRAKGKFRIERVEWPTYIYHRETPDSMCNMAAVTSP